MLTINDESHVTHTFHISDTHCHLGTEEDGPKATLHDLANAHHTLAIYLQTALTKIPTEFQLFDPESLVYSPSAHVQKYQLGFPNRKTGSWNPSTWLVDYATVIPLKDINRNTPPSKPEYASTHDWIYDQIATPPSNLRYRAYARMTHNNFQELDRLPVLKFLGISLNPDLDHFLDQYNSQPTKLLFAAAAKRNLPIILHIDNETVLKDTIQIVTQLHKETSLKPWIEITSDPAPWWHEPMFYDLLALDGVTAELTAVSIETISEILSTAHQRFYRSHLPNIWSTKFLYGTDFPYMKPAHAAEILAFILSKQFPGDNVDRQNVLWHNKMAQQLITLA